MQSTGSVDPIHSEQPDPGKIFSRWRQGIDLVITDTSFIYSVIGCYFELELDYISDHWTICKSMIFDEYPKDKKLFPQFHFDEIKKRGLSFV